MDRKTERALALLAGGQADDAVPILKQIVERLAAEPVESPHVGETLEHGLTEKLLRCSEALSSDRHREIKQSVQEAAVGVARSTQNADLLSRVLHGIGIIRWREGDSDGAAAALKAALDAARGSPNEWFVFLLEVTTAFSLDTRGDSEWAVTCAGEFLAMVRGTKRECTAQLAYGHALAGHGDLRRALEAYESAHTLCTAAGIGGKLIDEIERARLTTSKRLAEAPLNVDDQKPNE